MFVCPECGEALPQAAHCPHDGTPLAPRGDDPIVGAVLGPYRVARLLGVGGMGRVYKGVQPQIGSRVAIKVLSFECAQRRDLVERFFSEARAVNLIRHEGIVNVLDLATLPDGRPYIIMEYLDGAPLSALIERGGPLPLGTLGRLAAECLDALGAAHAKGIVHRDLKPDNVFVSPAGHPKLLDFGIAKLQENPLGSATQTGSLLGTPHYMAPEQAMGRAIDPRTDLYAMGVILFECATGRRPFHADSLFDLLRKHVDEPPPPPRSLRPDLPPAFDQVILQAMAKDPAHRWASAAALAQALQHACAGLPPAQWAPIGHAAGGFDAVRTPGSWPSGPTWPPTPSPPPPGAPSQGPHAPPTAPSGPPPHMTPPPQAPATPSTVSHGQVVTSAPSGGGKALWIGLVAALVIGGGATAAYLATRDGGAAASASAGGGARAAGGAAEDDPGARDDGADGADDADDADDDSDDADPVEAAAAAPTAGRDPTADLEAKVEAVEARLEAAVALAEAQLEQAIEQLGGAAATVKVPGTSPPPPPPPPPRPAPARSSGGAAGYPGGYPSGPVKLPLPAGWDAKAFDGSAWLATATEIARAVWPDAELVRIDAGGVRPDGRSDLTLEGRFGAFNVRYWFRSPSASKRPDDLPIGVKWDARCNVQMFAQRDGIMLLPMSWDCDPTTVKPPSCTLEQVWQKAIKRGAPGTNAVGDLGYRADFKKKAVWYVDVGEWSEIIPDGC